MDDLATRCQEVLDWHRTGRLRDGALRLLAKQLNVPEQYQLGVAENKTAAEAMQFVIDHAE
jgi:hypothetical protein